MSVPADTLCPYAFPAAPWGGSVGQVVTFPVGWQAGAEHAGCRW